MKLIIAGSRDFTDVTAVAFHFCNLDFEVTEIVSGGARGTDQCGEEVAKVYSVPIKQFIPDWNGLGKRAGFVRNADMADYADAALIFWDGQSKGSKHMIDLATKKGLLVQVVMV